MIITSRDSVITRSKEKNIRIHIIITVRTLGSLFTDNQFDCFLSQTQQTFAYTKSITIQLVYIFVTTKII